MNPYLCLGINPPAMALIVIQGIFEPALKRLPGGLQAKLSTTLSVMLGRIGTIALDFALAHPPPLLWILGHIYVWGTKALYNWFHFPLRDLLIESRPRSLLGSSAGLVDFSLASDQDRMAKVYMGKACPDRVKEYGTGCPDAISVRSANIAVTRYGDYSSPLASQWPGRAHIQAMGNRMTVASVKMSLCLRLPICDTKSTHASLYDHTGHSKDCSGHGTCVWNKLRGNHCRCHPGYWFDEDSRRCCLRQHGENVAQCQQQASQSPSTLTQKQLSVIKDLVVEEVKAQGASTEDNSSTRLGDNEQEHSMLLPRPEHGKNPDISADDPNVGEGESSSANPEHNSLLEEYRRLNTGSGVKMEGPEVVSDRCSSQQSTDSCKKMGGCQWSKTSCVDAAVWQCGVRKKILDCLTNMEFAPVEVEPYLDKFCGKHLFKQKEKMYQQCDAGYRVRLSCNVHEDCPITPHERKLGMKPKCIKQKSRVGCAAEAFKPCTDLNLDNIAAMIL